MQNKIYFDFSNHVVLITGGGSGLGRSMAEHFVAAGARVVITGRTEEKLQSVCGELGGRCTYKVHDALQLETIPALFDETEREAGPIHTLINNAGINFKKNPLEVTDEDFDQIVKTNLNAVFAMSREAGARMKPRGSGCIINITSMAALYGIPNVSAYTASKTAVLGLTRSLAVDFSPHGIRVNAIAPGFIDTPMLRKAFDSDPDRQKRVLSRTPAGRLGQSSEVAMAAMFLASDGASFITGVNLPVDGGNSIGF